MQRLEVIDRLKMVLERLAADGDAFLDNERGLDGGERVSLDGVGRVSKFEVLHMLEVAQPARSARAQPIKLGFFLGDASNELVHVGPHMRRPSCNRIRGNARRLPIEGPLRARLGHRRTTRAAPMTQFWSRRACELSPYAPGEQPRMANLVKLNTNESPFGPSPLALDAIRAAAADTDT